MAGYKVEFGKQLRPIPDATYCGRWTGLHCLLLKYRTIVKKKKKGKRKVQGVPQSQTATLPRHKEEEETDKFKQTQIKSLFNPFKPSVPYKGYWLNAASDQGQHCLQ